MQPSEDDLQQRPADYPQEWVWAKFHEHKHLTSGDGVSTGAACEAFEDSASAYAEAREISNDETLDRKARYAARRSTKITRPSNGIRRFRVPHGSGGSGIVIPDGPICLAVANGIGWSLALMWRGGHVAIVDLDDAFYN